MIKCGDRHRGIGVLRTRISLAARRASSCADVTRARSAGVE